jgi:hypothetical protein
MPAPPTSFGWLPDLPDHRDHPPGAPAAQRLLKRLRPRRGGRPAPPAVDWRPYFRPAELAPPDLAPARGCVSLVEYFERRATGRDRPGSVPFVSRVARRLQGRDGPCGAGLRATLKAAVRFGVPPERLWPQAPAESVEPPALLFGYARGMKGACYVRLDPPGTRGEVVLRRVKVFLAGGLPCLLGFSVPGSVGGGPDIPAPTTADTVLGGRCAVAVGYDDERRIRSSRGALLVRPSWGPEWGDDGSGWLPFDYVRRGLVADIWTLLRPRWLASGEFGWK